MSETINLELTEEQIDLLRDALGADGSGDAAGAESHGDWTIRWYYAPDGGLSFVTLVNSTLNVHIMANGFTAETDDEYSVVNLVAYCHDTMVLADPSVCNSDTYEGDEEGFISPVTVEAVELFIGQIVKADQLTKKLKPPKDTINRFVEIIMETPFEEEEEEEED